MALRMPRLDGLAIGDVLALALASGFAALFLGVVLPGSGHGGSFGVTGILMMEYDSLRMGSDHLSRWMPLLLDGFARRVCVWGSLFGHFQEKPLSHSDFLNCQEDGAPGRTSNQQPTAYKSENRHSSTAPARQDGSSEASSAAKIAKHTLAHPPLRYLGLRPVEGWLYVQLHLKLGRLIAR
jgi:hypothetical protein